MEINLNNTWKLRPEAMWVDHNLAPQVLRKTDGWMITSLPCDVHVPLIQNGIIPEPLEGDNFQHCRWVEEMSWWFMKPFDIEEDFTAYDRVILEIEGLEAEADILLNGILIGHQRGPFYPFEKNVKDWLVKGSNILVVRLTTGLEHFSEENIAAYKRGDSFWGLKDLKGDISEGRRAFIRRPQYVTVWDHVPRLATCGIMGSCILDFKKNVSIRSVYPFTKSISGSTAQVGISVEVENPNPYATIDADVRVDLIVEGSTIITFHQNLLLVSGRNFVQFDAALENAHLWWPNGMGEQHLYQVKACADAEGMHVEAKEVVFGVRTVRINMDKLSEGGRLFALEVNGVRTFCKGGDWVPADSIYSRVSPQKYETLLREAANANFTMLRIWGGGIYEADLFYELCDRLGILLWHDFMFSCVVYPDDQEWFRQEVTNEIEYQVKRLRSHASLALWCGNNESTWFFKVKWLDPNKVPYLGGDAIFNYLIPNIIHYACPQISYWTCSPYGGADPNSGEYGDKHVWREWFMNENVNTRISLEEFDKVHARFVSEYGYVGPTCHESLEQYHGSQPVEIGSPIWKMHTNFFEKDTTLPAIRKHYTEKPDLALEEYLLYGGLCQGVAHGYSLDSMRFDQNCWGSLIWDYNDSWGEQGWSLIDYYTRRKITYYFVKRAFAPIHLILREKDGLIYVMGVNDTPIEHSFDVSYGYLAFDGSLTDLKECTVVLAPFSRTILFEFPKGSNDLTRGCIALIPEAGQGNVLPAVFRAKDMRELQLPQANLSINWIQKDADGFVFDVKADAFAHAVHFNLGSGVRLSDEYFELLPGETRRVKVESDPDGLIFSDVKPICVTL